MYTRGSNAYKDDFYTHEKAAPRSYSADKVKTAVSAKKRINKRVLLKKRIAASVGALAVMAFAVLSRHAAVAQEFGTLTEARSELETVNAQIIETQVKAEGNVDPKKIEAEAQRLGLRQPMKNQIKYISLGNTDNGEVLKTEKTSSFNAFINRISVILEYLY